MDTTQYLDVFIDESNEHLDELYKQLLELENNPTDSSVIEEIFRAAHTLKGMSATMGYEDLTSLTHNLENVFDGIRYDKILVKSNIIDVLFEAVDHLNAMVESISGGGEGKRDVAQTVSLLKKIESGTLEASLVTPEEDRFDKINELNHITNLDEFELTILKESEERMYFSYEITVELNKDCLLKGARVFMVFEVLEQLGEVIKANPSVTNLEEENFDLSFTVLFVSKGSEEEINEKINKVSEIAKVTINSFSVAAYKDFQEMEFDKTTREASANPQSTEKQRVVRQTIRVNLDRLDILMNLFEELVIDRGRLEQISLELNHGDLRETVERVTRVSGELQNVILNIRMVPIDHVFNRFPSMIRQLGRELGKNIKLDILGADTEIDRTVIDEIGDPLVHLIRNAVDHGLELPADRKRKNKPIEGSIKLHAYHSGNYVFIEITDDGAGINKEAIINKAIENGVINDQEAQTLTDEQIYKLIMASGFSTSDSVSDVSGRGVGLDVVKNTIETLGGNISIRSKLDEGSVFTIQLPLTLSIVFVLLVELSKETYAIPLSAIIETTIIHKDKIFNVHNKQVIDFRGQVVPIIFLENVFSVPYDKKLVSDYISIVIVKKGEKLTGLVVDSFIGQQEVVLKSLGSYIENESISGATILGDGEVALIIDTNSLIN